MNSSTPQPTVYIVDDDQAMRKSLRWLVETLSVPVKTFSSAAGFLEGYDSGTSGCLVLDVRMPGMSGLELQQELRERNVEIPIIVMTAYANVSTAVLAMKSGAVEFLEKPVNDTALLEAIRRALASDVRRRAERSVHDVVHDRMGQLTPRESEILGLVVDGLSSKEIAAKLHVSFKTVEAHRAKIMKKMQAEGVAQLVRMTVSAGTAANPADESRSTARVGRP